MAANEVNLKEVEKELKDLTECCICLKSFDDPRMLPCIHTFCLKCIAETAAKLQICVGGRLPCPLCRKEFDIPLDGFSALQKNFFIEKLAKMKKMLMNRNVPCDGCLADEVLDPTSAEVYCEDCNQHLCNPCLKQHMKFKATRNHTIINVNLMIKTEDLSRSSAVSFCERHTDEELAIFCFDCRLVLCRLCFREGHPLHRGSNITREADTFRKEISNGAEELSVCFERFQNLRDQLKRETTDFLQSLQCVESEILQTADDVKALVDSDMKSVLADLESIKEKHTKEAAVANDEIDLQMTILETHSNYCRYIAEKGSSADICQAAYDLKVKTLKLKLTKSSPNEFQLRRRSVFFTKKTITDFNGNIVGKVTEMAENIFPDKKDWPPNPKEELFHFENTITESLDSSVSRHISQQYADDASDQPKQLLTASNSNSPTSSSISNTEIDRSFSKQEHPSSVHDDLKRETEETTPVPEHENHPTTLNAVSRSPGKDSVNQNPLPHMGKPNECNSKTRDLQLSSDKTTHWVEQHFHMDDISDEELHSSPYPTAIATVSHIIDLSLPVEEENENEDRFSDTATINTIRNKIPEFSVKYYYPPFESTKTTKHSSEMMEPISIIQTKEQRGITGFSILDEKIYVVSKDCSEVEVFDLIDSEFICRWNLKGLEAPGDLTSCSKSRCIYIMDAKHVGDSSEILRVDVTGKIIHRWYVQDNFGCMSVTHESNVIVAAYETHRICEYAPDGTLLHQVYLPFWGIRHPFHVLKLTDGSHLVSYGSGLDPEHGICIIQTDSDITEPYNAEASFSRARYSSDEMDIPIFLALHVDSAGDVLVADCKNNRVVLLNSCLKFKAQLLSHADCLRHPYRLHINNTTNRLVVSDNDSCMDDGRILVYEYNCMVSDQQQSESESFNSESEDDFLCYDT